MNVKAQKTHPILHGIGAFFAIVFLVVVVVVNLAYSAMEGLRSFVSEYP